MGQGTNVRVDIVDSPTVPVGMNSIRYLGNSEREANRVFEATATGKDTWGRDNPSYGVILSVWNGKDYIIKRRKGIDQ